MLKNLLKSTNICWITSLVISCTIPYITSGLLFLFSKFNNIASIIIWYSFVFFIQLSAIILGCRAFIISQNNGQSIISILCTIFANIVLIALLALTTSLLGMAIHGPFLN